MANTPEGAKRSGLTRSKEVLLSNISAGEKSAAVLTSDEALIVLLAREIGVEEALKRMRETDAPPVSFELDESTLVEHLPESFAELPATIHKPLASSGKFGIFGDQHIPYHDIQAIKTAFTIFAKHEVTGVLSNGDTMDFYPLSRYEKKPGKRSLKNELDAGRQFHRAVRERFKNAEIVEHAGNHDDRLIKWILRNEGVLWGIPALDITELLGLTELGIRFAPTGEMLQLGGLNVIHGDVLPGGGNINSARNLALKFMTPVAVNHWHIVDTFEPTSRVDGSEHLAAYNIGCMCGKRVDYSPKSTFQHGCMVVEYTPTEYKATNYLIDGSTYTEIRRK